MTLELHATPEEVMRAVEALQAFGKTNQVPEKVLFGLALALEECGSNIVNHALGRNPGRKFRVAFEHTAKAVTLELRDPGPEFDPTKAPGDPPGRARAREEDPPGGWGINLVRQYMDEIHYRRDNGENVLRLTKRLNQKPGT